MSSRTMATTTSAVTGARRRLKLLLFVMVIFMSWAAYTLYVQYGQMSDRSNELRDANQKLTDATAQSEALKQQIVRLNDQEYISEIARKQGLGYPGEIPLNIEK